MREAPAKFPAMSAASAGRTSAAPIPSRIDQPSVEDHHGRRQRRHQRTAAVDDQPDEERPAATDDVTDLGAGQHEHRHDQAVERDHGLNRRLPWCRSRRRAVLIDTFITDWSSTMTNWAVASAISGAHRVADPVDTPGAALPAGVVSVTVRSLHRSSQVARTSRALRRGGLITLVLRASRPQPVRSVLRSLSPAAHGPGTEASGRLRAGQPRCAAVALGTPRRTRENRGRSSRSTCRSSRSTCRSYRRSSRSSPLPRRGVRQRPRRRRSPRHDGASYARKTTGPATLRPSLWSGGAWMSTTRPSKRSRRPDGRVADGDVTRWGPVRPPRTR